MIMASGNRLPLLSSNSSLIRTLAKIGPFRTSDGNICRATSHKWSNKWSGLVINKSTTRLTRKNCLPDLREVAVCADLHKEQAVYQEELRQISKWWNELGLGKNLKLARNQPLKWYAWSMAILIDDISMSEQRIDLTKTISFVYLMDDLFDLYGTLDELIIFAQAITKWDYAVIDTLPDYMKMYYRALLDTTNHIGQRINEKHGYNPINSLKAAWASLCNAFVVEAKWFECGDLPRAEVYLDNGKVSSGVPVVLVHLFFLLGLGGVLNGDENHSKATSEIISSVATILRLRDDLGSAKDENQEGKDGSYVYYYRKQHPSLSVEQAQEHVADMISREWMVLNHLPAESSNFKKACVNFARMVPLMYSYDGNQQLPLLEEYLNSMLSKYNNPNQGSTIT